ncbi:hypothetical protein Ahy_A08g039430 [Arachis hypogaea]|uniref:Uncharacterized protein n=1 Tax=Arachis hypogaea TaxID=3818 RepID=A0A445BWQ4_ARAHY|nr:hypothetical protein Ahy_A08g039430 [Arachis hypogaea]
MGYLNLCILRKQNQWASKSKELMLILTIFSTPKHTTNATTKPVPTTTPCTPTSEPKNATDTTKPKEPPFSISAGNRNIPKKISPQPTASLGPKPNPPQKTMAQPSKTKPKIPQKMAQPTAIPKPWSKRKETKKAKSKRGYKNVKIAAACGKRPLTRAAVTGNIARKIQESSDSHDSDDSAEDEPYRLGGDEVSNEEYLPLDKSVAKTNVKLRSRTYKKLTKVKKAVMVEDDGPDDAYNDSDDGDSWHSEEMKTPPKSEDELEEVDSNASSLRLEQGEVWRS